jgi:hypothetical protein
MGVADALSRYVAAAAIKKNNKTNLIQNTHRAIGHKLCKRY